MAAPGIAWAAEGEAAAAPITGQAAVWSIVARAFGAALAVGMAAMAAGYAQARIGSAGAGTLAERPEVSIWIITLQALPEIIVLLGFVVGVMIIGLKVQ